MAQPLKQQQLAPAAPASLAEQFNQAIKPQRDACAKVLIVEDEDSLAEILEFNLLRQGFDVALAQDGLEACRRIGHERPDLVLLDILLPLLDGWEVCRMIRSHHDQQISQVPIIMLSALAQEENKLKGYDLGADIYLPKPYSIKEVILQSRQLIEQRRTRQRLSAQLESLQNMFKLQDNWQQALFHELRNQLTVISGMAEHICSEALREEQDGQFAEQIANSSYFLGSLAENYLLVRQFEAGTARFSPEPVQIEDLFAELKAAFLSLAQQKSCRLDFVTATSDLVQLHPTGVKIILANLLGNALKYSLLDGHICLQAQRTGAELEFRVCDDGPGIPEEERERVFDKFYTGKNQASVSYGSGLGLYIARTLARAMEGELWLDNATSGCCFVVTLPDPQPNQPE